MTNKISQQGEEE